MLRDSFGVTLFDSLPDLFMPIGFAGGLEDPDIGFVHFGYRDYPEIVNLVLCPLNFKMKKAGWRPCFFRQKLTLDHYITTLLERSALGRE